MNVLHNSVQNNEMIGSKISSVARKYFYHQKKELSNIIGVVHTPIKDLYVYIQ